MDVASIVVAVLALGVLVVIHEAGHYFAARWGGMKVSYFSVGFGPTLLRTRRGETEFLLGAIPFGGYVQIDGMAVGDGTDPDDPRAFKNRPRHLRAAAILAGPAANYLFAFLMLVVMYVAFAREPMPPFEISTVQPNTAAAEAGLRKGDLLVGVGGDPFVAYEDLGRVIEEAAGESLPFDVRRGEEALSITVQPKAEGSGWRIGIAFFPVESRPIEIGPVEAVTRAGTDLVRVSMALGAGLVALFKAEEGVEVSGPIGIVKGLSSEVQRSALGAFRFVAQLSIMLGFFNLLPIPALDGARLLFLAVGAVRRREVEPELEARVHGVGFLFLVGMLAVVSWFDITDRPEPATEVQGSELDKPAPADDDPVPREDPG